MAVHEMPPPPACPPALDPAAADLVSAVERMLASPCVDLPGAQSLERLRALTVVGAQLTALQGEGVRDCTHRELYALDGSGSTSGWLRRQASPVLPGAAPGSAERLNRLPLVSQAVRDGLLAPRSADAIARALGQVPDNPALLQTGALDAVVRDGIVMVLASTRGGEPDLDSPAAAEWQAMRDHLAELADGYSSGTLGVHEVLERALLTFAERLPAGQVTAGLEQLVQALRPETLDRAEQDSHAERGATLTRGADGHGWRLTADLDDEAGELASKLFTAYDRVERDSGIGLQGIIRSRSQRRHDALSAALRFALESGDVPADGGVRPHIAVTVSTDQLAAVAGALPARTDSGCPVPHATLSRWLCDSDVTLVLLSDKSVDPSAGSGAARVGPAGASGAGHALDVGRTWRTATPQQRVALRTTWAGCAVHGCGRGWKRLTPHHVVPWSLGGRTDLDNLVPICDGCHRDVHEDRRHLQLTDDRWIGPEGWVTGPPG